MPQTCKNRVWLNQNSTNPSSYFIGAVRMISRHNATKSKTKLFHSKAVFAEALVSNITICTYWMHSQRSDLSQMYAIINLSLPLQVTPSPVNPD